MRATVDFGSLVAALISRTCAWPSLIARRMRKPRCRAFTAVMARAPSCDERAAVEIPDRSGGKADGHEGENLARDILAQADAADRQGGRGLGEHVAARGFRHGGADRRVDDAGRDTVHAYRRELERERARQRLERAVGGADNRRIGARPHAQEAGDQRERAAGANVGGARAAPGAPELAVHGGAHVVPRHALERAGPHWRNSAATLSSLVTSVAIAVAPILSAAACKRSALREAMTTSAPSRLVSSAGARPRRAEPPTTTIFLPASSILSPSDYYYG